MSTFRNAIQASLHNATEENCQLYQEWLGPTDVCHDPAEQERRQRGRCL
jgi:hypothetical protein